VGCLHGDKKNDDVRLKTQGEDDAASFLVPDFWLQTMPPEKMEVWTDVDQARVYRAEACIIFRATRDRVISQKFKVEDDDGVVIHEGQTDGRGCLSWPERIPFNFFGQAKFMELHRKIRGSGVVRGYQTIKFALDPWKESRGGTHPEWEYLNQPGRKEQSEVPRALLVSGRENVIGALNDGFQHDLLIENLRTHIQQERILKEGVEISMNIEMNPWVQLKRMNDQLEPFYFNEGKFTVYASIVGRNMRGFKVHQEGQELLPGERVRTYVNNTKNGDKFVYGSEYLMSQEELAELESKSRRLQSSDLEVADRLGLENDLKSQVGKTTWTAADTALVNECREKIEDRQVVVRGRERELSSDEEYVQYVTDENCNILVTDVNGNLTPMLRATEVKMINGKLRVSFDNFKVEYHNTDGNMVFTLHVIPEGLPASVLSSYSAVYRIGEFNRWLGGDSPTLDHDNDRDLETKYDDLMASLPERDLQDKTREYYQRRGVRTLQAYEFSPLEISYASVRPGETATQRTIAYDINVQVSQPLRGGRPAQDLRMLIRTNGAFDSECIHGRMPITQELCEVKYKEFYADPTDQQGRVGWREEVSHAYYEVEHFIRKPITFEVISDDPSERFETTIDAAINPWDLFATFGKDLRYDKAAKA
ncbi:MAG: hypothetical protein AAF202_07035, partial [Pseudomonadota bacterium]